MGAVTKQLAILLAAVLSLLLASGSVAAHEMTLAEMQVRETAPGRFVVLWTATNERAPNQDLQIVWPEGCTAGEGTLRCGPGGLQGAVRVEGIGRGYSAAMLKVYWADGQTRVYTLTSAQPQVQLYGSADDERGRGEIANAYLVLGVEHILSGIDHLLFVIGLLFLVGFRKQLIWTITAFTAAHSLTLASAALGWLTLRPAPVEVCIALSIVLVAGEALRNRATLARRWPALVAFVFGLVHGLGFAGALKDIGLPENHLAIALLTFNAGVELGQLLTVGAAWLLAWWLAKQRWPTKLRTTALYGIGAMAAYWSLLRLTTVLT